MSLPANFPTSLDALANPTATTNRDDSGFELDLVISRIHDILEALEAKVGIGASLPSAAGVLRRTAPGVTAWGQILAGDYGPGSIAPADVAVGAGQVRLARQVLGASNTIVDFVQIPQTYTMLILRWKATTDAPGTNIVPLTAQFSVTTTPTPTPDTGTNYYWGAVRANNSAASAPMVATTTALTIGQVGGATAPTTAFQGAGQLFIPEYATASKHRNVYGSSFHWGTSGVAAMITDATGGAWVNATGGLNQIRLSPSSGSFLAGSTFELWAA